MLKIKAPLLSKIFLQIHCQYLDNNLLPKCLGIHHEARSYFVDEYECKFLVCNNGDVFSNKDNPFIKKFLRTKKLERICNG